MTAAVELRGVVKDYGRTRALRGIDLRVERGRIFGFLGPNGAGKTTTLRILLDLIRATSGTAEVLGYDSKRDSIEVRRRTGYLPGELRTYEAMRVTEFLDFIDSFRPAQADTKYRARLTERLGLDPTRRVRALSKGNKQKLGLIQALMHRPELLILDEPTSGLDPLVQDEAAKLFEEAAADGRTVFLSSHVLPEVERVCHDVAIIREGEIVAVEDIARLKSRSAHVIEITFASPPPPALFDIPGVHVVSRDGATVRLQSRGETDAIVKAAATQRVLDFRTEQPSLEDIFLSYYSANGRATDAGAEVQRASA